MQRKKSGASYIVVIIIFMFVSTVSMAMLSMVAGNYRGRVVESKRVENLYSSESGLDVTYNIIGKTFDAAAQYGNLKVNKLQSLTKDSSDDETSPYNQDCIDIKKDINYWKEYNNNQEDQNKKSQEFIDHKINDDNTMLNIIINEEFKRAFNNFILKYDDKDYANKELVPDKLKESIIDRTYVNEVKDLKDSDSSYDIAEVQFPNNSNPPNLTMSDADGIQYNKGNQEETKNISLESNSKQISIDIYNNEKYTIIVKSEFESKDKNTSVVGNNLRTVQATYTMSVPDYSDIYFTKNTGNLEKYPALQNRGITIGGNMDVSNLNNFNVSGDIFVKGDESRSDEDYGIVYNKYKGGIKLNNINNLTFNNDVITDATFNIGDEVGKDETAKIVNNLYARNLYAGNINGDESNFSNLNIGNLIVDNDITLKANDTHIKIDNFYGINERTVNDGVDKEKNSSCIIVNGNSNSNVKINTSAYIMGVAYIDTKDETGTISQPYKTGESLAVKGNYIAYAVPNKTNETFSYYNPLYLLDYDNSGDEVSQKRQHFEEYWNGKLSEENTGGISLPSNTKAIGAIMYKDLAGNLQVKNDDTNLIDENTRESIIEPKRIEYAQKVYNMGYPQKNYSELNTSEQKYLQNLYDLVSTTAPQYTLDTMMNLPEDIDKKDNKYNYSAVDEANKNNIEKAIVTKKDILIKGDNASNNNYNTDDYIFIDASNNREIDAVIATEGNVIIDGDVSFKGSIIAKGDLTVKGQTNGNTTSVVYDPEIVERIQSQNIDLFKDVFGGTIYTNEEDESDNSNEILNPDYDVNKFLNIKLWKLVK